MNRYSCILIAFLFGIIRVYGGNLEGIRQALEHASLAQVQEKVYVHTDNPCYFVGDTLWYKAYVVRADDLHPTNLSRILYVELLSPDGLLVERQNIVVNPKGYTCGQFVLHDSLYSGYYELRAYTRWMLNFNVSHHKYSIHDTWLFYNKQMAADYFRMWDGLYSRVMPIYSKPDSAGDYDVRRMYQRPKTRVVKPKKDELLVNFYPEGGHLVRGIKNHVAFDITDQYGEAVNLKGTVTDGTTEMEVKAEYMGRGSFTVVPATKRLKARFTWRGKQWDIDLPKAETDGVGMYLKDSVLTLQANGQPIGGDFAVSVLCRGSLKHFVPVQFDASGCCVVNLPWSKLPTGVNDVTLFDEDGHILADRLFFVNHNDQQSHYITAPIDPIHTYNPYEKVELPVECAGITEPTNISISIRDAGITEPTYNDGDIMTDLLLSSELRGFIAYPAHYFERDDDTHRRHLDLLMMVQGWRKYKWQELADTTHKLRYAPELTMTVEGTVYKMLAINEVEPDEVSSWQDGVGMVARKTNDPNQTEEDPFAEPEEDTGLISTTDEIPSSTSSLVETIEYANIGDANVSLGVNHGNLRREVLVEAEIIVDSDVAGSVQKTQDGHFLFQIPPFYGDAFLNIKAYKENDSINMNMASRKDKHVYDEDAFPDYYVKRDLFYPMYTHEYNYYEKHQPEISEEILIDTLSELSMENDVHQLSNVNVKGRRRGRRAIDWKKPAFVMDAYDLYNEITDRGLSFGKLDMRQFPIQVCRYLYGNMNRYNTFHVDGRIDGFVYYRNYSAISNPDSEAEAAGFFRAHRTSQSIYKDLKLRRLQDIRVFSDFEPRTEDSTMIEERYSADATVELVQIPNEGEQHSYRDRHIVFHGFNAAEAFYQPDYGSRHPSAPTDYRRTLYWNPNAKTDEKGRLTVTFYNNSKPTRIKMSAAGITSDGRLLRSK